MLGPHSASLKRWTACGHWQARFGHILPARVSVWAVGILLTWIC